MLMVCERRAQRCVLQRHAPHLVLASTSSQAGTGGEADGNRAADEEEEEEED